MTSSGLPVVGIKHYGKATATAGTVITRLIEPWRGMHAILSLASYTAAGTAHTLTVMRPLGRTTLSAAAAASQGVVVMAANPGTYAAGQVAANTPSSGDYFALELDDGTYLVSTTTSLSSLTLTLATNLPHTAKVGNNIWFFGVITDVNPEDGAAHPQFTLTASAATVLGSNESYGIVGTLRAGDPLLLHSGNGTAAGILDRCTVVYSPRGGNLR